VHYREKRMRSVLAIWRCATQPADGGDACVAGSVKEVYTSPEPGTLRVESITRVGDKVQRGLQVYRRQ